MQKRYTVPAPFQVGIEKALAHYNLTFRNSPSLAKAVLTLSDYFIEFPEKATPWKDSWAQVAYLAYYLPLNSVRLSSLFAEAERLGFFTGIKTVIDFGAGLATASMTLNETHPFNFILVEKSSEPKKIIESYFPNFAKQTWQTTISSGDIKDPKRSLALFSYSLTELNELPSWALECEALMIVEPSTQQDGRKLLALREKLIKDGYSIWGPCTHQGSCALLNQSKTDWCHDRVHFSAPTWFTQLEQELPMKNRTLTYSYLLARKTKAPVRTEARTVGDQMKEKGKTRQMVCRNSDREFLAWLKKNKVEQEIPRGVLIDLPADFEKVSNEIRVTQELVIK